jgi:serine/threonine-protein kinase
MPPAISFDGCDVLEKVKSGPVTDVYRAVQEPLGRPVVIKALGSSILPSSPFAATLEREARLLAQLSHPNVLTLHDFVRRNDRMWLVLEHVDGWTLRQIREKLRNLPQIAAAYVGCAVAAALAHAHERGVVHRDVRPENVLISRDGEVKLSEFAVATDERLPTAPEILDGSVHHASLAYASPEQVLGEAPDPRSDLFSLGVVLFELVAGQLPFGVGDEGSARRIRDEPAPPLTRFVPDIVPAFDRAVQRCLQKLPGDRFQSAMELSAALEASVTEMGGGARASLLAALVEAGFDARAPSGGSAKRPKETRSGPNLTRVSLVLASFAVLAVVGGAAIQLSFRAAREGGGERPRQGRLELAPEESGYLRVVADPWAHVIVDGQKLETTPFAKPIPLSAGTHYVRLEHPRAPEERRTIHLIAGETIVLDVSMKVDRPARAKPVPEGATPSSSAGPEPWSP